MGRSKQRFTALVLAIVALAAGALLTASRQVSQTASAQAELRVAMDTETVDGKLTEAIKLYQGIVDKYGKTERRVAATALVRLADCYRKLGDTQARSAYERVVRDFSDIADVAATARARIADLGAGARSVEPPALTLRRVYDGPGLNWCNGLTSDTRYLSFPDYRTGNIAIVDTRSGLTHPVTTTGSIGLVTAQTGEFGECSLFSPDDSEIAFYWGTKGGVPELRVAGPDGSNLRTLYRDTDGTYLLPTDWSSDGRFILVIRTLKDGSGQLATIARRDGSLHVIKEFAGRRGAAAFSPDGRFVAYYTVTSPDSSKADVFVVATDGTGDVAAVQHPADDFLLGWSHDGSTLFFGSDRTGSFGVWSIAIENGRPGGTPVLVKADIGAIMPIRLLNGTLYYALNQSVSDIYTATFDPAAGRATSPLSRAKPDFTGSKVKPAWSPDGASLAYLSLPGTSGYPNWPQIVSVLNVAAGTERHLRPAVEALEVYGSGPSWSPDGSELLVLAQQQTPDHGLYRVNVLTGATTRIVKAAPGTFMLQAVWSRDGRSVFFTRGTANCTGQDTCQTSIVRRDLATGQETNLVTLVSPAGVPNIAPSPDGRWLAFTGRTATPVVRAYLAVVPTSGGQVREIYPAPGGAAEGGIALPSWAPDGRFVYFMRRPAQELWRVRPDGSESEKVDVDVTGGVGGALSFSPDGRRIAVTKGKNTSELWALEGLETVKRMP